MFNTRIVCGSLEKLSGSQKNLYFENQPTEATWKPN